MSYLIISIFLLAAGIALFVKAFITTQRRDKRFNKGVKRKANFRTLIYSIFGFIAIYASYKIFLLV